MNVQRSRATSRSRARRGAGAFVLVTIVAASTSAHAADDAAAPCSTATTEEACLRGGTTCAWGTQEAGTGCFDVGAATDAQPGSGDPGGGGQAAIESDDGGCTMSNGNPSGGRARLVLHGVLLAMVGLGRRARRPARVEVGRSPAR